MTKSIQLSLVLKSSSFWRYIFKHTYLIFLIFQIPLYCPNLINLKAPNMNVFHSLLKSNTKMVIENKNENWSDSKKNNVPELNVLHFTKPFNFVFLLFGIQRSSYDQNKISPRTDGSKVYGFLFIIFVTALSVYGFTVKINRQLEEPILSSNVTQNIGLLFLCCTGILSLIISNFVSSKLSIDHFYNIVYIDRQLGLPQECYVRKRVLLAFFSFFLYLITVLVGDFVAWYDSDICTYVSAYINMWVLDLIAFQYLVDIWIVTFRLRILVAQLVWCNNVKLYVKEDSDVDFDPHNMIYIKSWKQIKGVVSKSNIWDSFGDRILRLTSVYDKLADNVDIINTTYGIQVNIIFIECLKCGEVTKSIIFPNYSSKSLQSIEQ